MRVEDLEQKVTNLANEKEQRKKQAQSLY